MSTLTDLDPPVNDGAAPGCPGMLADKRLQEMEQELAHPNYVRFLRFKSAVQEAVEVGEQLTTRRHRRDCPCPLCRVGVPMRETADIVSVCRLLLLQVESVR